MYMVSYVALLSLLLSPLAWVRVSSLSCTLPYGSTPVYDLCAIQVLENSFNSTLSALYYAGFSVAQFAFKINSSLFDTTHSYSVADLAYDASSALYSTIGRFSVADLLVPAVVIADQGAYSGGGFGSQNVTVVEALTANLRLDHNGSIALFDQTQLLAAGLFAASIDNYPNIKNPYLLYLEDLDTISQSLTDIDSNTLATNSFLEAIIGKLDTLISLFTVVVPTSLFNGTIVTTKNVPLSSFLFDALYQLDVNTCTNNGTCTIAAIPIKQALLSPYLDASIETHTPGVSCPYSGIGSFVQSEPPYRNGMALVGKSFVINSGYDITGIPNVITMLPSHLFQTCPSSSSYGNGLYTNDLAMHYATGGNDFAAIVNAPLCYGLNACGTFPPPP